MPNIWNAIYPGNSATFPDPVEGNDLKENAAAFVGNTYGSIGDPLANHIVEVTAIDNGGIAPLDDNNLVSNDQVSYDLGGGVQTTIYDGHVGYAATITYMDGTTDTFTAVVFRDASGNLFLAPELTLNVDTVAYEAQAIRSITLNSVTSDIWDGLWTD